MFLGGYRSDLIVILGMQNLQAAEAPAATPEAGSCFLQARRRTGMHKSFLTIERNGSFCLLYGVFV